MHYKNTINNSNEKLKRAFYHIYNQYKYSYTFSLLKTIEID